MNQIFKDGQEAGREANTWPFIETIKIGGNQAINAAINLPTSGNFFKVTAASGVITASINGNPSTIAVVIGQLYRFDDNFGIPATITFFSTVLNDTLTVDVGNGIEIPVMPGSSPSAPASIVASTDETYSYSYPGGGPATIATFLNACPTILIFFSSPASGANNIFIGCVAYNGNNVFPPIYDVYGNQVTDSQGNINQNQLYKIAHQGNGEGVLVLDGSGIQKINIASSIALSGYVQGCHFASTFYAASQKTQPGWRAQVPSFTPAAATTDFLTITPYEGSTTAGDLVLERAILYVGATTAVFAQGIDLIRRSTLDSAGTSTTQTGNPADPFRGTTEAPTITKYTANPTTGNANDTIDRVYANIPVVSTGGKAIYTFDYRLNREKPKIPYYSSGTWQFAFNLVGAPSLAGATIEAILETTVE